MPELRSWLEAGPPGQYVRRTAHWMDEAVKAADTELDDDPGLSGLPVVDALVGAAVESVALRRGRPAPRWVRDPGRFLDQVWYPGPRALLPWALVHAPAAFKVHGVLVEADSLACV